MPSEDQTTQATEPPQSEPQPAPKMPDKDNPEPGLYDDVPRDLYDKIEAVNPSWLVLMDRSPKHFWDDQKCKDEPSISMRLGTCAHTAILEPDEFDKRYLIAPKVDRRTKVGMAAWAKHQEEAGAYREVVIDKEAEKVKAMSKAVWSHPQALALLAGEGRNEVTAIWLDKKSGELCKGRIDRLTYYESKGTRWPAVVDVKTTADPQPGQYSFFARQAAGLHYPYKLTMYLDGLNAIAPMIQRQIFVIAVENVPPYDVVVYNAKPEDLDTWRKKYQGWLENVHKFRSKSGAWPGYSDEIQWLEIPPWSQ